MRARPWGGFVGRVFDGFWGNTQAFFALNGWISLQSHSNPPTREEEKCSKVPACSSPVKVRPSSVKCPEVRGKGFCFIKRSKWGRAVFMSAWRLDERKRGCFQRKLCKSVTRLLKVTMESIPAQRVGGWSNHLKWEAITAQHKLHNTFTQSNHKTNTAGSLQLISRWLWGTSVCCVSNANISIISTELLCAPPPSRRFTAGCRNIPQLIFALKQINK